MGCLMNGTSTLNCTIVNLQGDKFSMACCDGGSKQCGGGCCKPGFACGTSWNRVESYCIPEAANIVQQAAAQVCLEGVGVNCESPGQLEPCCLDSLSPSPYKSCQSTNCSLFKKCYFGVGYDCAGEGPPERRGKDRCCLREGGPHPDDTCRLRPTCGDLKYVPLRNEERHSWLQSAKRHGLPLQLQTYVGAIPAYAGAILLVLAVLSMGAGLATRAWAVMEREVVLRVEAQCLHKVNEHVTNLVGNLEEEVWRLGTEVEHLADLRQEVRHLARINDNHEEEVRGMREDVQQLAVINGKHEEEMRRVRQEIEQLADINRKLEEEVRRFESQEEEVRCLCQNIRHLAERFTGIQEEEVRCLCQVMQYVAGRPIIGNQEAILLSVAAQAEVLQDIKQSLNSLPEKVAAKAAAETAKEMQRSQSLLIPDGSTVPLRELVQFVAHVAFTIGCTEYVAGEERLPRLDNSNRSAKEVGRALRALGYKWIHKDNATKADMEAGLKEVMQKHVQGRQPVLLLIYYGGHGVEADQGICWLGVDAKLEDPATHFSLREMYKKIMEANARKSLAEMHFGCSSMLSGLYVVVVSDSCRTGLQARRRWPPCEPLQGQASEHREGEAGGHPQGESCEALQGEVSVHLQDALAKVFDGPDKVTFRPDQHPPPCFLIILTADPGRPAEDGDGSTVSPWVDAFRARLAQYPHEQIRSFFDEVGLSVGGSTFYKQRCGQRAEDNMPWPVVLGPRPPAVASGSFQAAEEGPSSSAAADTTPATSSSAGSLT